MSDDVSADELRDPFWSVVQHRHPDLDIVVLPPAAPAPTTVASPEPVSPEMFAREHLARTDRLWGMLVGHGMPRTTTQWIPGRTRHTVSFSAALTLADVDEAIAKAQLRAAADLLAGEGWRVFVPPTGMPRVEGRRDEELGETEVLIGYAPAQRNLFLRCISGGIVVDPETAHDLLGAA